ncbi:low molecular weight protein tyrosine phosphatase family protein [Pseudomonas cichorii]|uniref:low molecular weight protein tyrosine phosphatase family protein n=1 Tax=Pseudomonas cichorii TaxID=36746 RepID=UPI001C8A63D6|nr:low molecular weight protein tyrosine phosphatase family protein [Pseudomonas cichorii]MBX8515966.1 low molecular weight protein tyrosine phosphatase family protein [Pseudomonas cichorii]MBX8574825.1 low molecular weight protein tyrosine phosphatase family protein [Pseudomonas cichorii]
MLNVLFICGKNRLRSPTAEHVFAQWPGVETASAGVGRDADIPVDTESLEWADVVFVMEPAHRRKLAARFRKVLADKRIVCLDIPDDFEYMSPDLITRLRTRVEPYLPAVNPDQPR